MFDLTPLSSMGKSVNITMLIKNLIPIGILVVAIGLLLVLPAKSKKGIFITKLCTAFVLSALFIFRFVFWIFRIINITTNHTFTTAHLPRALGLDVPMFLTLLTIITLFVSAFSKKKGKFLEFLEYTLLCVGFGYGIITLFRLDMIDRYDNLYHMLNIGAMINMLSYLLVPMYLVKTKELKPKLSKFWFAIAGFTCIYCLTMMFALVYGNVGNFSEMLVSTTLKKVLGWKLDYPWHLLITIPAFVVICLLIYAFVCYVYKKLAKPQPQPYTQKNEFFDLYSFATKSIGCMQGFLLVTILGALIKKPMGTPLAYLCLIPFVMTLFCVLAANELDRLALLNDESVFNKENKEANKAKAFVVIGNVIYGLVVLKQMNNERESIEQRKIRAEKRRLKELQKQQEQQNKE